MAKLIVGDRLSPFDNNHYLDEIIQTMSSFEVSCAQTTHFGGSFSSEGFNVSRLGVQVIVVGLLIRMRNIISVPDVDAIQQAMDGSIHIQSFSTYHEV